MSLLRSMDASGDQSCRQACVTASDYVALSATEFAGDQIKWTQGSTPREITLEVSGDSSVEVATETSGKGNPASVDTTAAGSGSATLPL